MPTILPEMYITDDCRTRIDARINTLKADGTLSSSQAFEWILTAGLNALDEAEASAAARLTALDKLADPDPDPADPGPVPEKS